MNERSCAREADQLTCECEAETGYVNEACEQREPHDDIQDRTQNHLARDRFAGHTQHLVFRSCLNDTLLLSREWPPQSSAFPRAHAHRPGRCAEADLHADRATGT